MHDVDVIVIGAGAVGLACAAALAGAGHTVAVVERHRRVGQETSSRNSGVIHAGFHHPTGTLKARLCVTGRGLLYARAARLGLPHRRCGKLVVATSEAERAHLATLHARGIANGAGALQLLDGREVTRLEPAVRAVAGLLSPETGIVDAHALVDSYRREAEARGGTLALGTTVEALELRGEVWRVVTRGATGEVFPLVARRVVNAAGLEASRIAALAGLDVGALGWQQRPCKGDYFHIAGRHRGLTERLVYPVPAGGVLGVHLTFDLGGELHAGPDAEYVDRIDYAVDPAKAPRFGAALRRYLPAILDEDLSPAYSGVRPRLQGPGAPFRDFVIEEGTPHGAPGMINLVGIESPGLTASEAIAGLVVELAGALD